MGYGAQNTTIIGDILKLNLFLHNSVYIFPKSYLDVYRGYIRNMLVDKVRFSRNLPVQGKDLLVHKCRDNYKNSGTQY